MIQGSSIIRSQFLQTIMLFFMALSLFLASSIALGEGAKPARPFTYYSVMPKLDERCTINILNGSTRVKKDGSFSLLTPLSTDVPYRARAICQQGEAIFHGESALINGVPNGETKIGEIFFDQFHPIPVSLSVDAPTKKLDINNPTVSLQTTGVLPDGTSSNLTLGSLGTVYSASSDVVTVSENGIVKANRSGRVIVSARHEGVMASIEFDVFFPKDSDGDGLPDDYETRNGLDPSSAADADLDLDGDGLSNKQEYLLGTSVLHQDTDGDNISDFEEGRYGTDPLKADSDQDGLVDGEELLRGTDPLMADTDQDGLSDSLEIQFGLNPTKFTETASITGRVIDENGNPISAASIVALNAFSAVSDHLGMFRLEHIPVLSAALEVTARVVKGGAFLDGRSHSVTLSANQQTSVGDIIVAPIVGQVHGSVYNPRNELVVGARLLIKTQNGEDTRNLNADYQGMFQISDLPKGPISVIAQDPRTGLYGVANGVLEADKNLKLNIHLQAYGTIRGKVYLSDGLTPAGADQNIQITRVGGNYRRVTSSNAFGEYQFEFLPLGEYQVEASGKDKGRGRTTVVLSGTSQINDADVSYLGVGTVRGYVEFSDGSRWANGEVLLDNGGLFPEKRKIQTDNLGQFEFTQVYAGPVSVYIEDKKNKLSGQGDTVIEHQGQLRELAITLTPTGIVEGRVLSHSGQPVKNASVSISGREGKTNDQGEYRLINVPVGGHEISVKTDKGDMGSATVEVKEANKLYSKDVKLIGLGRVRVTVSDAQGKVVSGVQLSLTSSSGKKQVLNSNAQGQVDFQYVLAGRFSVSAFDPIARLGGSISSLLNPAEDIHVSVSLEPAADILGTVYQADGTTPAANVLVRLSSKGSHYKEVRTSSNGKYQFNMQALAGSPYSLSVLDAQFVQRAYVNNIQLKFDGEKFTQDMTMLGNAQVQGKILRPDGSLAKGAVVNLSSAAGGRERSTITNALGEYRFNTVPVAAFVVDASEVIRRFAGKERGEIKAQGENVVLNVTMKENQLPDKSKVVANLQDGNGFSYAVWRNGFIADGTHNVFAGNSRNYRGANRLDVVVEGKLHPFSGEQFRFSQNNREILISGQAGSDVRVERKVYVPQNGYFSRTIETLSNRNSSKPVMVEIRLDSHYQISSYDRVINGSTRRVRVPVGIVSSSSGDGFLNVTSARKDHWLLLDDDMDEDPFINANHPALIHFFGSDGAQTQLSSGEFLSGIDGSFNRLRTSWVVSIPAGQSVSIMHFLVEQTDRAAALASIQRLEQFPEEALEGITQQERAQIKNFKLPDSSSAPSLPSLSANVQGQVTEYDGKTPVASSLVSFQSQFPLYKRQWSVRTDKDGKFQFKGGQSQLVPLFGYKLSATHPQSSVRIDDSMNKDAFDAQQNATSNMAFVDTGLISGAVRRHNNTVASHGYVELMGDKLDKTLKVRFADDGEYRFAGIPAGNYRLVATLPNPNGSSIGGSIEVKLDAKTHQKRNISLAEVKSVSGRVLNGGGNSESNLKVIIYGQGFHREVITDSAGFFEFLDMPLGTYTLETIDPYVGTRIKHQIEVQKDQSVSKNLSLTSTGQVNLNVSYDDKSIASLTSVSIKTSYSGTRFIPKGSTNAQGRHVLKNIPVGNYEIKVTHPKNSSIQITAQGSVQKHGEIRSLNMILPVDNPPTIVVNKPIAKTKVMRGTQLELSADVKDDFGIKYVAFYLANEQVALIQHAPYERVITLDTKQPEGELPIRVVAVDKAGNQVNEQVLVELIDDNEKPEVNWLSPVANTQYIESQSFNFSLQASDNVALKDVVVRLDGEVKARLSPNQLNGRINIPGDYAAKSKVMKLIATATDRAGNTKDAVLALNVKEDALPQVAFTGNTPKQGQHFIEGQTMNFMVSASDDLGVTRVDLLADGKVIQSRFSTPYQFSLEAPLLESIKNPLSMVARAYDTQNQPANTPALDLEIRKNLPPQVAWIKPAANTEVTEGRLLELEATASDDLLLDRVEFYQAGTLIHTDKQAPFTTSYRMPSGTAGENVQFDVVAIDSINQRTKASVLLKRLDDTQAPQASIEAPLDGSIVTLGDSDVVIAIDTSGSTSSSSGSDVNGDGSTDNILVAEVHAAKELLGFLSPKTTRVAIVDFSSYAVLMQGLTNDFDKAREVLDKIQASGPGGGTNFGAAMRTSNAELLGSRSRAHATPVQLLLSDGSASYPQNDVKNSADAGIIVNGFAVGGGANVNVLKRISENTGGVATKVPNAGDIARILPRIVLFGIDSLLTLVDAQDDIAIKDVVVKAKAEDGSVLSEKVDTTDPYSLALGLPAISDAMKVKLSAKAKDYGDNEVEAKAVDVTLLPAKNTPILLKVEPQYPVPESTVIVKGRFLIADNSNQPSRDDESKIAVNQLKINDQVVDFISATKAQIAFKLPANGPTHGEISVLVDGKETNKLSYFIDTDQDGLHDEDEAKYGTSPTKADTDGDGLSDSKEIELKTNPLQADSDGDGIKDKVEVDYGLDPNDATDATKDLDQDGISNIDEIKDGTDIRDADTDNDGLNDGQEKQLKTNPKSSDTDGDGLGDAKEVELKTDPLKADTDGDGVNDYVEHRNGLNPLDSTDLDKDDDSDGLTNKEEIDAGTNAHKADTDDDGLSDGEEVKTHQTSPTDSDSDNDGEKDGYEVSHGTDPKDPSSSTTIALPVSFFDKDNHEWRVYRGGNISAHSVYDSGLYLYINNSRFYDQDRRVLRPTNQSVQLSGAVGVINVDRQVHVSKALPMIRHLDRLTNTSDAEVEITVRLDSNFYADSSTQVLMTSSGDKLLTKDDNYAVIDDSSTTGGIHTALHYWSNAQAELKPSLVSMTNNDRLRVSYTLKLPAHGTVSLLHFAALTDNKTQMDELLKDVLKTQVSMFEGLDLKELEKVKNFNFDTDKDGLPDVIELRIKTDINKPDTDGDTLTDRFEYEYGLDPLKADDVNSDVDGDGLTLAQEQTHFSNPAKADTDADGISDGEEVNTYKTSPTLADSDRDSLNDGKEIALKTNPLNADSDNDGLNDGKEVELKTDPLNTDTDGDGVLDGKEVDLSTNPLSADTDGDGLSDGKELTLNTNPLNADSDDDGLSDAAEVNIHKTSPLNSDSDSDGLNDGKEIELKTNPLKADSDDDGLSDAQEVNSYKTNPLDADTDGDGIHDGYEIRYQLNPLDSSDAVEDGDKDGLSNINEFKAGTNPLASDTDGDGLNDADEVKLKTNPVKADSDGDGESDGFEVAKGTDPLDKNSSSTVAFPAQLKDGKSNVWTVVPRGIIRINTQQPGSAEAPNSFIGLMNFYSPNFPVAPYDLRAQKVNNHSIVVTPVNPTSPTTYASTQASESMQAMRHKRHIFASTTHAFVRYLDEIANPNNKDVTLKILLFHRGQNISNGLITSSGNSQIDKQDIYMVTPVMASLNTAFGHLWGSDGSNHIDSTAVSNSNHAGISYELNIPANSTVSLLSFVARSDSQSDVENLLKELKATPAHSLDELSIEQMESITNFNFDSDNDGLIDKREALIKTDPNVVDTDNDGLLDGFEYKHGFDPLVAGEQSLDSDGDGLTNLEEQNFGSNPKAKDTDNDGLNDDVEKNLSTNPKASDTDGDGLSDKQEYEDYKTNPSKADTDDDGLKDGVELQLKTNPLQADSDADGINDGKEVEASLNPLDPSDASADLDKDGLSNLQENQLNTNLRSSDTDGDGLGDADEVNVHKTNPLSADTDSDGLKDAFEINYGFNPIVAGEQNQDPDSDGLSNLKEQKRKSNPTLKDTDGDGVTDDKDDVPMDATRTKLEGVLLVDDLSSGDTTNKADAINRYKKAFELLSMPYSIISTNNNSVLPTRDNMADKRLVLWATGESGSLTQQEENSLSTYLNGGGCAILTSQDHHYARKFTPILNRFMGLSKVTDDVITNKEFSIEGTGLLYSASKTISLSYLFSNYTDSLTLVSNTQPLFKTGERIVGSYLDSGDYLSSFLSFALSGVKEDNDRADIIKRFYDQCTDYSHDVKKAYTPVVINNLPSNVPN